MVNISFVDYLAALSAVYNKTYQGYARASALAEGWTG